MLETTNETKDVRFANHQATLYDFGGIKLIHWGKPDSLENYIRFIFDAPNKTISITGNCGYYIVRHGDATYETCNNYFGRYGQFAIDVRAYDEPPMIFDYHEAFRDVESILRKKNPSEEKLKEAIDELKKLDFTKYEGFLWKNAKLENVKAIDPSYAYWICACGKRVSPRIKVIVDCLETAWKQLHAEV